MVAGAYTRDDVFSFLSVIPDPEIPVVNIQEMGMLRDVTINDGVCEVVLTPTYSGCPAMGIIAQDIKMTLEQKGISPVKVRLTEHPAWTTDWMTDAAKQKLKDYGIAPPLHSSCNNADFSKNIVACPRCGSEYTSVVSRFGATACKAMYKCEACKEPFEYFKCH